jgi:hypothetical protein
MTVVAVGRWPSCNVLIADTGVGTGKDICEREKVLACGGNDIFCTVIGDEQVLHATAFVASWNEPAALDLRDAATVDACYLAAGRRRILMRQVHESMVPVRSVPS